MQENQRKPLDGLLIMDKTNSFANGESKELRTNQVDEKMYAMHMNQFLGYKSYSGIWYCKKEIILRIRARKQARKIFGVVVNK